MNGDSPSVSNKPLVRSVPSMIYCGMVALAVVISRSGSDTVRSMIGPVLCTTLFMSMPAIYFSWKAIGICTRKDGDVLAGGLLATFNVIVLLAALLSTLVGLLVVLFWIWRPTIKM